jgi:ABC-type transporter Mla subunit MlaD
MSTTSTTELDQTISALQGGIASVPAETAVSVIDSFEKQVRDLGANNIADNLVQLKQLLTSGSATGQDVSQVLTQLGSQTASAASGADASLASKLQQLGKLLSDVGSSLS